MVSENPVQRAVDQTDVARPPAPPGSTCTTVVADGWQDGRQSAAALAIRRGTCRQLAALGLAALAEVTLPNGRRADLLAIGAKGEIWIVEIKSCLADFQVDGKWPEYRDFADRLWFAVDQRFPLDVLPDDVGIIVADRFGADILRDAPTHRLAPARAKALHLAIARLASQRLHVLADPDARIDGMR